MLYLLPDELLVVIVEFCDQKTRKSLSLVSRMLRDPSQRIIFKVVCLPGNKFEAIVPKYASKGGRLSEMIQNDRVSSYIQTLIVIPPTTSYHLEVNALEPVFTALH
jgi:hypothetical protein